MHTKELESLGMETLKCEDLVDIVGGNVSELFVSFRNFFGEIFNKQTETEKK
ncbi:MAG: hypothetical protein IJZ82_05505 [Lachnospiraceae bacterium]|nr:hypothetical protein [Lachnospiraceae bacterium]